MSAAKLAAGAVVGLGGVWAVAQLTALSLTRKKESGLVSPSPSEADRRDLFSKLAPTWDATVRWDEFTSGISRWRRQLVRMATGDVLEVAAGTGRNMQYYTNEVSSVTCLDFSRRMLEVMLGRKNEGEYAHISDLRLVVGNCSCLKEFHDNQFDTVVDTFGICSFEDPVSALREMGRVCKPGGRILLLEHGQSDWPWMQSLLSSQVGVHVKKFGCYNHRNIEDLVQQSGLKVVSSKRKHWGTIYFLVCEPPA